MDKFIASFKAIKNQCLLVIFIAFVVSVMFYIGTTGIPIIQAIIRSLTPLWWAIGIAYVMNLPMRRIEKFIKEKSNNTSWLNKHSRSISMTITVFLVLSALGILTSIIIPQVISSVIQLFNNMAGSIAYLINNVNDILEFFNLETFNVQQDSQAFVTWFTSTFNLNIQNIVNELGNLTLRSSQSLIVTFSRIIGEFFNVFMGFLLSLYLLADKEKFVKALRQLLALSFTKKGALIMDQLCHDANTTFTDFVSGQFIEAIIFGTLCYVMMTIFRFPMAMLISVVAAILCLIPMFGPTLGMLFGALIILTSRPILTTVGFMIFYQTLQQIENNLIYPRVVGVKVGLPAVLVLLSIIVFGSFSGVLGMLVAVPLTAVLYNFYQKFVRQYLKSHNIKVTENEIVYDTNSSLYQRSGKD